MKLQNYERNYKSESFYLSLTSLNFKAFLNLFVKLLCCNLLLQFSMNELNASSLVNEIWRGVQLEKLIIIARILIHRVNYKELSFSKFLLKRFC